MALQGEATLTPARLFVVVKDHHTGNENEWPVCTLTTQNPSQRIELMLNSKETKFKATGNAVMVIGHANPGELDSEDEDSEEAEEQEEVKGAPDVLHTTFCLVFHFQFHLLQRFTFIRQTFVLFAIRSHTNVHFRFPLSSVK